ncbi:hypothetical protein [Legionella tunisiensis]|uniref:hypothetical protein n=1 Tax=Legionella tunisiensis TaxID=1034944 RepID=UPI0002E1008B|nr:hypothetical protein [Legionella tunisiensis]
MRSPIKIEQFNELKAIYADIYKRHYSIGMINTELSEIELLTSRKNEEDKIRLEERINKDKKVILAILSKNKIEIQGTELLEKVNTIGSNDVEFVKIIREGPLSKLIEQQNIAIANYYAVLNSIYDEHEEIPEELQLNLNENGQINFIEMKPKPEQFNKLIDELSSPEFFINYDEDKYYDLNRREPSSNMMLNLAFEVAMSTSILIGGVGALATTIGVTAGICLLAGMSLVIPPIAITAMIIGGVGGLEAGIKMFGFFSKKQDSINHVDDLCTGQKFEVTH